MSNGEGCKCFARSENECACGVNWNQKPLTISQINGLFDDSPLEITGLIYSMVRLIEKAHGIGE